MFTEKCQKQRGDGDAAVDNDSFHHLVKFATGQGFTAVPRGRKKGINQNFPILQAGKQTQRG